jgi:PAS domain S-box-containing protein
MKLQEKTSLILIVLLIISISVISIFVSLLSLSSYLTLEESYISRDASLAAHRIEDEALTLSALVSDWGPWDDTYHFFEGTRPGYVQSNLQPETFANLRMNVILIVDRDGGIVYAGAYDTKTHQVVPVPGSLYEHLRPGMPLMKMDDSRAGTEGILLISEGPMLVASRPVVRTDFSGIPRGVVIMGRYLDAREIERLSLLTNPALQMIRADDAAVPSDILQELQSKERGRKSASRILSDTEIAGYCLLDDIYGNEALILQIRQYRDIYQQGVTSTLQYILIVLAAGLFLGVAALFMLDRLVLSRIMDVSRQVSGISTDSDVSRRVMVEGNDEFAGLAAEINRMLDTLDTTRQKREASENRFRELTDLLPQSVFEMDTAGTITYVNKFAVQTFGFSGDDFSQGLNARDVLLPKDHDRMAANLQKIASGQRTTGEIYSLKKKDHSIMRALIYTAPVIHNNTLEGFRGSIIDITDRLRLQDALSENREMLDGILRASPVGVFRLDAYGHITFTNETFTTITGIPFEEIRGTYWADILPADERQRVLNNLADSIRERKMTGAETWYIHPNGTRYRIYGQTVPLLDEGGVLHGWVGTITDITEQKKIEDALKESEEKYRALTENTPDVLISTDMNGIITYVSPQINKYGYLVEEVMGRSLGFLIHPGDLRRVETNLSREMEKGAQFVSEFRIVDKWGGIYWIEEKSSLRLDLSGKPIGIYGIIRDITERKRVEDAIDIANKKLNLMNQITRHDILNTITGLLGCVDMAHATESLEEKTQLLNDIKDLTRVIQRHITFTREYQEVGVHLPQWQNVDTLLRGVLESFRKSPVSFQVEFEKIEIYADPLLEKVFYNLIDNALRYGATLSEISIYSQISDKGLSLVFEDNGVGVDTKQKMEIFKRGVGKNTGMGLFLTAEILAITGISIEENGVFGTGARFEIRIPNGTWRFARA